ncbi:MAG: bifunctional UDP-sugar hydrolase/5'-nucleotidase [Lachnospiraceae bacterium]|nr:bifunctional UDP-sugar hydrolase/5'-nucleotidase [Lachnospiraceae bacterium]
MKRLLAILMTMLLILSVPVSAENDSGSEEKGGLTKDVVVLFTSDVHCGVDEGFTYIGLKQARKYYEDSGAYTLLVDNGDAIQGEPLGTLTKGMAIIRLMNKVGYDIATIGNHEFDYGMDGFFNAVSKAEFPYISCNFNKEGELVFDPYIIKEFDGVKIAFVGVTTPLSLITSTPKYFKNENGDYIYGFFEDETGQGVYDAVQKAVDDARAEGAEYVVVMGHMGNEEEAHPWNYADVISHTNGIDAFLDGHSHDIDRVVMKNKDGEDVVRQACGTKMSGIGYLKIPADGSAVDTGVYLWKDAVSVPELFGFKNELTEAVSEEINALGDVLDQTIARTEVELTINDPVEVTESGMPVRIVRLAETNLGDLCADAIRDQAGSDIAFANGGGIRSSIDKGDITYREILSVHPYGNMLTVIEVTGQQILDALEWGSRAVPEELGGFLQVSGLTYEINSAIESPCIEDETGSFVGISGERRVQNVMAGGEPIDPLKNYTLAAYNYMLLDQGDGYTMFDGAAVLQDSVKLDNQVLIDYITDTLGGVVGEEYADPYGEGRIVILE